ncbi:MAG: cellulose binding domain-containing protein [Lachnospiraceae bacterium]|nr:cellulose binding domain-containing protein [Lachnospiraceae bacterium]
MVVRSSGKGNDFNFDDFESFNNNDSSTANLADNHDFDDFFNSDFYNDSDSDLFFDDEFEEPTVNTNYRRNQNYDNNSKNSKTKIANIPNSIYNKFSGTDNEVARYILMVLIVFIICSIIGGTFAYLTSKNNGSDDTGYNRRLFHMTEGYPDDSNDETDIEQINTASIENEDIPLDLVSADEPTIEDTDTLGNDSEDIKAVATVVPTVMPTVQPTLKPTVKPTVTPTAKPTVKPTAKPTVKPTIQPTVKPEPTVDNSSNNNSANDAANNNGKTDNNNSTNNNNNSNVIPENKPEIICTITPAAKWWPEGGSYKNQYDIYITNKTSNTITDWHGVLSLSSGVEITNLWGAKYGSTTGSVRITPESWNKEIKPNESAYFKVELKTKNTNTLSMSLSVEY